jgi:hypothetical protein
MELVNSPTRGSRDLPTNADHKAKAAHNEDFVKEIDNPFFDWKICGMFYVAVHYVDAYLAKVFSFHPSSHAVRTGAVQRDAKLKPIFDDYRELLNESRTARYEFIPFGLGDVARLQRHLDRVKSTLSPLI